jgi:DNA-binding NtrC family response regulator
MIIDARHPAISKFVGVLSAKNCLLNRGKPDKRGVETMIQSKHGETILLVEDEPAVLETLEAMLGHLGYRVVTAANGQDALTVYKEQQAEIALVISDMMMPDMTGEKLYQALKAENRNVRAVMMSGYPGQKEAELTQQGIVAWFQKPVSFGKLSEIVNKALVKTKNR